MNIFLYDSESLSKLVIRIKYILLSEQVRAYKNKKKVLILVLISCQLHVLVYFRNWINMNRVYRLIKNKHFKYSVPFFTFIVGGSFYLREFTSMRYKYSSIERVNPKEELKKRGISVRPTEETTLEKTYERFKESTDIDHWENQRIPRPKSFE